MIYNNKEFYRFLEKNIFCNQIINDIMVFDDIHLQVIMWNTENQIVYESIIKDYYKKFLYHRIKNYVEN